ncbi:MAG: hypothetical protein J07HX5_00914 [halophilic archaeon J07HX5]|jgi:hypothetical protein|nr:MAG: hypothetical protein J07HX5_00914 [halophilic archaeon J07HX5]
MRRREATIAITTAAIGLAGCSGSSDGGNTDAEADETESEQDAPQGEVVIEGQLSDAVSASSSAQFESGGADDNLVVDGTVTNESETETVRVTLQLQIEDFQRNASQTIELEPGTTEEYQLKLESIYTPQFAGYTVVVEAEQI